MPKIFISYSHKDEKYAKLIQNTLIECNLEVFMSGSNIHPGEDWEDVIWTELEESDLFLFIASKQSVNAEYTRYEIGGAFYGEKDIVSVLIDVSPEELPSIIQRYQAMDFRGKSVEEIEKLISKEGKILRRHEIKSSIGLIGAIFSGLWLLGRTKK